MIITERTIFETIEDKQLYDKVAILWVESGTNKTLDEFAESNGYKLKYERKGDVHFMSTNNYGATNPSTLNGVAGEKEIEKMNDKKESQSKTIKSNLEKGNTYSMEDLRRIAKERGINSFGMKKEDLEKAITQ